MDYLVVIEQGEDGQCSAYVPDLPGCVALGDSVDHVQQLIQEAIAAHIESMREDGEPIPPATTRATTVHTDAA